MRDVSNPSTFEALTRWSCLSIVLLGCGGTETVSPPAQPPPQPPPSLTPVASVTITPGPAFSLAVALTTQLTASVRDAQGNALSGRRISWTSSDDHVATVSPGNFWPGGLVTAVGTGSAAIQATSEGKTGTVTVTVLPNPWSLTGSLATDRTFHTATLLMNGKVLVAGGQVLPAALSLATCELYDPATGTWSPTGSMTIRREFHIAIRLLDGKVLVAGGYSFQGGESLSSSELYDPDTGTWSATGSLSTARQRAAVVLLPNGKVLVAGGSKSGSDALNSAELYDPATGTWSPTGAMTVGREGHSATLLENGTVLVAGGSDASFVVNSSAEVYDPQTGTWIARGGFTTARGYFQAVLLPNGKALIAGGADWDNNVFAASDLYDPASGLWSVTGSLNKARTGHTLTLLSDGRVLAVGGFDAEETDDHDYLNKARTGHSLPDARLLAAGGVGTEANGSSSGTAEVYDPVTGVWSDIVGPFLGRGGHAAVLLTDGKVLVVGGQGSQTNTPSSAEIFDPAVAFAASNLPKLRLRANP